MKYLISHNLFLIFWIVLLGTILGGCSNEMEHPDLSIVPVDESSPTNIGFDLRSVGTEDEGESDNRINSVRVILVRDNIAGEIVKNIFIPDLKENPLTVELLSGNYRVYVIVNEYMTYRVGNRVTELDKLKNYADLKKATLPFVWNYFCGYNNCPMFGQVMNVKIIPSSTDPQSETNIGTVSVNGGAPESTLRVSLKRLLCKLNLRIKETTGLDVFRYYNISISNLSREIPLFEDYNGALDYRTSVDIDPWYYQGYYYSQEGYNILEEPIYLPTFNFYPRNDESKAPRLELKSQYIGDNLGAPIGHNIDPVAGELDYTLHQNYDYTLSVNFTHQFPEISLFMWHHWIDENVNTPLNKVWMLEVPAVVVMNSRLWGGSYTTNVYFFASYNNRASSHEMVKIYVEGNEVTGKEGNLPDTPEWLTEAKFYIGSNNWEDSSYFTFTYKEMEDDQDLEDYVITLQMGNIVKQLRVKYKE